MRRADHRGIGHGEQHVDGQYEGRVLSVHNADDAVD
jgi:hypothetical protein